MKKKYVLDKKLGAEIFIKLLSDKGATPYKIAKKIYGKSITSPVRVYQIIKELKNSDLIKIKKDELSKRKKNLIFVNFKKVAELLNEHKLPNKYKLTEDEIEELAKVLEEVNYSKLEFTYSKKLKLGILDFFAIFLKLGALFIKGGYESEFPIKKYIELTKDASKKVTSKVPPKYFIEEWGKLSQLNEVIIEKLTHINTPSWFDNIFEMSDKTLKNILEVYEKFIVKRKRLKKKDKIKIQIV